MDAENKKEWESDWELSDDFYKQDDSRAPLSLEDFIMEEEGAAEEPGADGELERVAELVRRVVERNLQGKTVQSIAEELDMEMQEVQDILVCVQTFPEDNPMAVARLLVMG